MSFVTVVHCNIGIFLRNGGSLQRRKFPSSRWFTATKKFSFVAVIHHNEGTFFFYRSGSPWHDWPERKLHIWFTDIWIHTSLRRLSTLYSWSYRHSNILSFKTCSLVVSRSLWIYLCRGGSPEQRNFLFLQWLTVTWGSHYFEKRKQFFQKKRGLCHNLWEKTLKSMCD